MYWLLDKFFFVFHSSIIAFSLFGWIWEKTRKANLVLLLLIGLSWFGLGIWYGIGYCPCTDWHWQVRKALGHENMPNSYTKFLIDSVTGIDMKARFVDALTVVLFALALIASVYTNVRDWRTAGG